MAAVCLRFATTGKIGQRIGSDGCRNPPCLQSKQPIAEYKGKIQVPILSVICLSFANKNLADFRDILLPN